jgi:hypothetical protein
VHQHCRLFERICSLENLILAAKAALRGKRTRLPGAAFLADFEKEVSWLHDELWAGTYRHGGYTYQGLRPLHGRFRPVRRRRT